MTARGGAGKSAPCARPVDPPGRMVAPGGNANFGWFAAPIGHANLDDLALPRPGSVAARVASLLRLGRTLRTLRTERWHVCTVADPTVILTVVVARLGYLGAAVAWVAELATGKLHERSFVAPFGRDIRLTSNGIEGSATLERAGARIVLSDQCTLGRRHISVCLPAGPAGQGIGAEVSILDDLRRVPPLVLLCELPRGGAVYSHRAASLAARGELRVGGWRHGFEDALGAFAWWLACPRRRSAGRWAAASGRGGPGGSTAGFWVARTQSGVEQGAAAFWVDGRPTRAWMPEIWLPGEARLCWAVGTRDTRLGVRLTARGTSRLRLRWGPAWLSLLAAFGTWGGGLREEDGSARQFSRLVGVAVDYAARW